MDTGFSVEQEDMRRALRELLGKREGDDSAVWREVAGLTVPQPYGGLGCGAVELAVVCEEAGRALLSSPLLGSVVLGVPLIRALGTEEQRARLLPGIAAGELTVALAAPVAALGLTGPNDGDWAGGGRAGGVQARRQDDGTWRLYGQVEHVLGGHSAGLLLVAAHAGGFARSRTLLFAVRAESAAGLVRVRQTALDGTRPQARIELREVEAELVGGGEGECDVDVREGLARVGEGAGAALAAEAVGAADGALARTVEYVKIREQFGRPIGSFQAVRHRLADVYVKVAAARSAAYYAACEPQEAGGLALAQALDALRLAAGEAVQLHGGVGFTWEHDTQLYFKRAAGDALLFGPVHRLRARAAERAAVLV